MEAEDTPDAEDTGEDVTDAVGLEVPEIKIVPEEAEALRDPEGKTEVADPPEDAEPETEPEDGTTDEREEEKDADAVETPEDEASEACDTETELGVKALDCALFPTDPLDEPWAEEVPLGVIEVNVDCDCKAEIDCKIDPDGADTDDGCAEKLDETGATEDWGSRKFNSIQEPFNPSEKSTYLP